MANTRIMEPPYYDDFDATKQYIQLLAMPGRVAQSREFNVMQSTLRHIIKSLGDSILKNGDIVEGCQVIVEGRQVTVTEGKVYMEGMVMPVNKSIVTINGTGVETIGIEIVEVIIDENADSSLRDPAQGYDNYGQPGCNRLRRSLNVVANKASAATIATLIDGALMIESYAPEYDALSQTLARRTYDESGSYVVDGLSVHTEHVNNEQYNLVIDPGKSYILGYELKIPTSRRILVDRATTSTSITTRGLIYNTNRSQYTITHSGPYVGDITKVEGKLSVTERYTMPNSNTLTNTLRNTNVIRITSVSQGSNYYTVGNEIGEGDCYLIPNGSRYEIKWNGTDQHPAYGTEYNVTYEYYSDFVKDVDYQLVDNRYLSWVESGNHPLANTDFSVTYELYLARKDIVYIDRYGHIEVAKGVPDEYGFEVYPETPLNTLILAKITNPPNGTVKSTSTSDAILVENVGLKRFTMNDIQNILNRIQTIEYDQAVLALNDEARLSDTPNDKKGIWTEPLIDLSRIDFYHRVNSIDSTKPLYDMALDLASNICYLPVVTKTHTAVYNSTNSTAHKYNRLVSLAVNGERSILSQTQATTSFPVNPYSRFPQVPEVSINPAVDSWIEDTIIEVPVSLTNSLIEQMSTRTLDNRNARYLNNRNYETRTSSTTVDTAIGTRTESYTQDSVISQQAITYIRPRTITVTGTDFPENLDNIRCEFDGIPVNLTPVEGTSVGTDAGTVRSNDLGMFKATFEIPSNVRTGVREVSLKSNIVREGAITEGFTLYIAEGLSRRIERTVTTVTTVLLERVTTNTLSTVYVDPVGQTFVLDNMSIVKGINVYFESKPTGIDTPIVCEIRGVSNGTINSTIYAHKSLRASEVKVSADSSVATRFNFDDPVLLEEGVEYAFVLRSTSSLYHVWVSELGQTDRLSGAVVLKNAYMSGVMMSSSNNSSWTNHQAQDIKFDIMSDTYTTNSRVIFEDIPVGKAARLFLLAESAMPSNTKIEWEYSVDGRNYKKITPYNIVLLKGIYNNINLQAIISREGTELSPLIALDTIYLTASHFDTKGYYVSKNISDLDAFTNVRLIVDTYTPVGTNLVMKISTDNGETLQTMQQDSKITPQSNGWEERVYNLDVASATQCRVYVEATTNAEENTPAFRRLRVIMN